MDIGIFEKTAGRLGALGIHVLQNESLSGYTTFRIGGPAPFIVFPSDTEETAACVKIMNSEELPFCVLGNGSNVLVPDAGIEKAVIQTGRLSNISFNGSVLTVGAGCLLSKVASEAAAKSLSGMEALHGIPGSVGGAVIMNAGAYGSEISGIALNTVYVDAEGAVKRVSGEDYRFGYRRSCFLPSDVITATSFSLVPDDGTLIKGRMNDYSRRRRASQPLEYPSAGSVFKRPEGYFAGKLIEDCGLKGRAVGGAEVSEKHAGFIVNRSGATCSDVLALIEIIRKTVLGTFGVELETEIRILS